MPKPLPGARKRPEINDKTPPVSRRTGAARRAWRSVAIWGLLMATLAACGEEPTAPRARVGEGCARNDDCAEGLACLQTELRCVVLCALDSDDCGAGIACQAAGQLGFCPLPPAQ